MTANANPAAAPVLPAPPIVGVAPAMLKDPLDVMTRASRLGPLVRLPMPFQEAYVYSTPKLAEHALVTNAKNYGKQVRSYDMLRMVLGNGLVTSEGEFWKRQRRIAQPAFHRERLASFADAMARAGRDMVAAWTPGVPFDLNAALMKVTLRIVGETMMSTDVTKDADAVGEALTVVLEHLMYRVNVIVSLPEWVPTPGNREFKRCAAVLVDTVQRIIAQRRKEAPRPDLLSMLMDQEDPETHERMDDQQLLDEVMTVFLAGHETTSNLLSWTFVLLGQNPAWLAKLEAEVDQVLQGRLPTMADVPRLEGITRVLKESLRLYPPVWTVGRSVNEDEVIDGVKVGKGSLVFVSPWVLHRDPTSWDRPLEFDPDRWAHEPRVKNSWMPVIQGQSKCIGDGFAMMEAQLLVATIVQAMHVELVPGQQVVPEPVITLRPRDGVQVTATRRG